MYLLLRLMRTAVLASCLCSYHVPGRNSSTVATAGYLTLSSRNLASRFFFFFYFLFVGSAPLRKVISRGSYGANDLLFAQHCCMQLHLEIHGNMPVEMLPPIGAPFRQLAAKKHLDRRVAISMRSMDVLSVGYQSGRRPYIKRPTTISMYLSMS